MISREYFCHLSGTPWIFKKCFKLSRIELLLKYMHGKEEKTQIILNQFRLFSPLLL